ncbi:hypothetical protein ABW21_db0201160 [Orbilia brochopaga]|nr:hypothetical protein ABW21_db0201160 [Drechslerella brochopaga]
MTENGRKMQYLNPEDQYEFQSVVPSTPLTGRPPTGREGGCWPARLTETEDDDNNEADDYFSTRLANQETFTEPALSTSPCSDHTCLHYPSSDLSEMDSRKRSGEPQDGAAHPTKTMRTMPPPDAAKPLDVDTAAEFKMGQVLLLLKDADVKKWVATILVFGPTADLIDEGVKLFMDKLKQKEVNDYVHGVFGCFVTAAHGNMRESRKLYDKYYWDSVVKKQATIADMNLDMSKQIEIQKAHIERLEQQLQQLKEQAKET